MPADADGDVTTYQALVTNPGLQLVFTAQHSGVLVVVDEAAAVGAGHPAGRGEAPATTS
jgi:hypothetical protein